jgi:hypothetical protein
MTKMSRIVPVLVGAFVLGGTLDAAPAIAATAEAPAVAPVLLDTDQPSARGVDMSVLGVVAGSSSDPSVPGTSNLAQRWVLTGAGFVRQALPLPEGGTSSTAVGLDPIGEVGANVAGTQTSTPVRYDVLGRAPTPVGSAGEELAAVGPNQWLVDFGGAVGGFGGRTAIVARDGGRTVIGDAGGRTFGRDVAGPATALIGEISGIGFGTTTNASVFKDGRTVVLPPFRSFFAGPACWSSIRPDGTVAYSGLGRDTTTGAFAQFLAVHHGGVPGTEQNLPTGGRIGSLDCSGGTDQLAADGDVVGRLNADATNPQEAVLWHDGRATLIPPAAGEVGTDAVAVADGGRVVVLATSGAGVVRPSVWQRGVRTPLTVPNGWTLGGIVTFTDTGFVLGNVTKDGNTRPVVWRVPLR